jgi:response regulator NasT
MARILIIEDDRLVLTGLVNGLEDCGYAVTKAASGEEAVSLAEAVRPDLLLADVCLPGISGIEATQRIREKLDIPVVFLSALDTEEVVRQAITLGSLSYLVKPVTIKQLVPAIESALARGSDISRLRSSEENLSTALRQSRGISIAIGMLMERHDLTAEDAFEILRANARRTRSTTGDVAGDVISGALNPEPLSVTAGRNK